MDLHQGEDEVLSFEEERDSEIEEWVEADPRQQQWICEENGRRRFELGFLRTTEAI